MPFIEMIHLWLYAQQRKRLDSAYTQHKLLPDSPLTVGRIKFVGNLAIPRQIAFDIGIEQ